MKSLVVTFVSVAFLSLGCVGNISTSGKSAGKKPADVEENASETNEPGGAGPAQQVPANTPSDSPENKSDGKKDPVSPVVTPPPPAPSPNNDPDPSPDPVEVPDFAQAPNITYATPSGAPLFLVGEDNAVTVTLTPSPTKLISAMAIAETSGGTVSFKGGSYPGTGGTCGPQISAACTLVLSFTSSAVANLAMQVKLSYLSDGEAASLIVPLSGQAYGVFGQENGWQSHSTSYLNWLSVVRISGGKFFSVDYTQKRVYMWHTIPTSRYQVPDLVIGAPSTDYHYDVSTVSSAAAFSYPYSVCYNGSQLFVSDYMYNRILVWNGLPTVHGKEADFVIGQDNFSSFTGNKGGSVGPTTLYSPADLACGSDYLLAADASNYRAVKYTLPITANSPVADLALGQPDLTTNTGGADSDSKVVGIAAVAVNGSTWSGSAIAIGQRGQTRALKLWHTAPATSGVAPAVNMTSTSIPGHSLGWVTGVDFANGHLLAALDTKVLYWSSVPAAASTPPTAVLGKSWAALEAYDPLLHMAWTWSAEFVVDGLGNPTRIVTADPILSKVMFWNSLPSTSPAAADEYIGISDYRTKMYGSDSVTVIGDHLYVNENWARTMIWNLADPTNKIAFSALRSPGPDRIKYQAESGASQSKTSRPRDVQPCGNAYVMSDTGNNRVLVWNSLPASTTVLPDYVLGQPNFTTNSAGTTAKKMNTPRGIACNDSMLVVADYSNNRVLGFALPVTASDPSAVFVLGQPDFTSSAAATTACGLKNPAAVFLESEKLIIADTYNNRVVIHNTLPTGAGGCIDASTVVGQADFVSGSVNRGLAAPTDRSLNLPWDVMVADGRLYVVEYGNNRVTAWNTLPTQNDQPANLVIGQPDFSGAGSGTGPDRLGWPISIASYQSTLLIADAKNYRVLWIPMPAGN